MNPLDEIEIRGIDEEEGVRIIRASDGAELFRYVVGAAGVTVLNAAIDCYRAGYAQGFEAGTKRPEEIALATGIVAAEARSLASAPSGSSVLVAGASLEVESSGGDPGDDDPLGIRAKEIAGQAIGFLNALRDPEVALKKLGAWMRERYPERVATSYWITVGGERDKGFSLSVVRLPKKFDLAALLGTKTFGLEVKRDLFQIGDPRFGKYNGARVSLGLAAVTDYADREEWTAALTLGIRF